MDFENKTNWASYGAHVLFSPFVHRPPSLFLRSIQARRHRAFFNIHLQRDLSRLPENNHKITISPSIKCSTYNYFMTVILWLLLIVLPILLEIEVFQSGLDPRVRNTDLDQGNVSGSALVDFEYWKCSRPFYKRPQALEIMEGWNTALFL